MSVGNQLPTPPGQSPLVGPHAINEHLATRLAPPPIPKPRTWGRYFKQLALRLAAYWLIYTLSIGPLFWIWFDARYVDGPKWIAHAYRPLAIACDVIPYFGTWVNWYINLWIL